MAHFSAIAGAIFIVVGLVTSAITSPLIDRSKKYSLAIKLQVPIIAICYLAFIWASRRHFHPSIYNLRAAWRSLLLSRAGRARISLRDHKSYIP
jgi:hypothetical protein